MIHRLVAEAYIPNPDNLPQVDHIDNNPYNNHVNNLQWITAQDNIKKSYTTSPKAHRALGCKLFKGDKLIAEFDSVINAARFISKNYGGSVSWIRATKKYKDYVIKV